MKIIRGNTLEMIFSLVYIIETYICLDTQYSKHTKNFFNMSQSWC